MTIYWSKHVAYITLCNKNSYADVQINSTIRIQALGDVFIQKKIIHISTFVFKIENYIKLLFCSVQSVWGFTSSVPLRTHVIVLWNRHNTTHREFSYINHSLGQCMNTQL